LGPEKLEKLEKLWGQVFSRLSRLWAIYEE
jgi:hypothetical protein